MKYTVDLQYFGGRGADSGLNRTKATIRTDISELKKRRQEYADREFNRKTEEERKIILRNQNRLLREELENRRKEISKQLGELANKIYPHQDGYSEKNAEKYYQLQNEKNDLYNKLDKLNEQATKNNKVTVKQNSKEYRYDDLYGGSGGRMATSREITSSSWERQKRRKDKEIANWMKNR